MDLRLRKILMTMLLAMASAVVAVAQNFNVDYTNRYILVINSYNENTPWSRDAVLPVNDYVLHNDTLYCETVYLNGRLISNKEQYDTTVDRIFKRFEGTRPKGIVMVGSMAFTMRDRIKEEWGDVPILVLTRLAKYGPTSFYFSDRQTDSSDWKYMADMATLRDQYNFTLIEIPEQCQQTVDLMVKLQPQMQEFVFLADNAWINGFINQDLETYIAERYPNLKYSWAVAGESADQIYVQYMDKPDLTRGILMNTWAIPDSVGSPGYTFVQDNMQLVTSSVNPIFTLRSRYVDLGAVGGVFPSQEQLKEDIERVMTAMALGEQMSEIPFRTIKRNQTVINYTLAEDFGLDLKAAPEGTLFINMPESFWDRYRNHIIGCGIAIILILAAAMVYMMWQRNQLRMLRRHASFVKNMPWPYSHARVIYDSNGVITDIEYDLDDMNSAFFNILESNLLPNKKWKIFPFDFISEKASQLVETGEPVSFTYHFDHTDTYYEFLLCRIEADPLAPGERPQYIDVFANDITQLSKADLKLQKASSTLNLTLQVSKIVPWQWDLDKREISLEVSRLNYTMAPDLDVRDGMLVLTEEEFLSLVYPEDRDFVRQIMFDFHSGKVRERRGEYRLYFDSGKRLEWVEINSAIIKDNKIIGSLLVITERKKKEQDLIEAKERAAESDKLKSAFLANMSHEIRTPLNAIIGFSNMLTTTKDERKQRKFINIIEHNNQLLLHLVNDVLDLAKIESNTLELNMTLTDINAIMEQVKETVRLRVPQGVMLNMVLGGEQCMINTDPNRLTQVLINLLTNATKFTTKGSISFGYEQQGDELYFYVKDTGIGISQENQQKLFGRFSKLNNFAQGTGLGLAISKSIINKLGGEIGVKSRGEGKGATFWFTLPYENVQPAIERVEEPMPLPAAEKKEDVTILVAEDNPSNYILFESILADRFNLLHANDGSEAIDLYNKHHPDLILMDIGMPNVDGMEATAQIRKTNTRVPIIAVTAYAFLSDKKKILKNGFNDYVPKPINPHDLLESISRALNKPDIPAS